MTWNDIKQMLLLISHARRTTAVRHSHTDTITAIIATLISPGGQPQLLADPQVTM